MIMFGLRKKSGGPWAARSLLKLVVACINKLSVSAALGNFAEIKAIAVTIPRRYTGRRKTASDPRLTPVHGI
jgi:hypothetical protein